MLLDYTKTIMTKEQFLKRCETAWNMGLAKPPLLQLMYNWCDAIMRYEGNQMHYFHDFFENEKSRTKDFTKTLANDTEGYKIIQLTSLLNHPCQKCAEDTNAWHTRSAFCEHRKGILGKK